MYAEPIPPYGEATLPILFAPYGEYADAFLFTADVSVDGRSGNAGAEEDEDKSDDSGVLDAEIPVDTPVDDARAELWAIVLALCYRQPWSRETLKDNKPDALELAAPPLSHGLGGDTVAILRVLPPPLWWCSAAAGLIVGVVADDVSLKS